MDREAFRKAMIEIGRRGGQARAKAMTAEERRKSAIKASKAAAKARTGKRRPGSKNQGRERKRTAS